MRVPPGGADDRRHRQPRAALHVRDERQRDVERPGGGAPGADRAAGRGRVQRQGVGDHDTLPYDETAPLLGRHPYDVSKSAADLIAQSYWHTFGLRVAVTRCGNLFGGGDLNWNRIVPGTIRSALAGERPVIRSDGRLIRDYLYVEDAVDAYLLVAEALAEGDHVAGEGINVSYEQP